MLLDIIHAIIGRGFEFWMSILIWLDAQVMVLAFAGAFLLHKLSTRGFFDKRSWLLTDVRKLLRPERHDR